MPMHDQVLSFFGFSRLPFGKHLKPADTFPSHAVVLQGKSLEGQANYPY